MSAPATWCFSRPSFHSIKVLIERIKLFMIYLPPYGEDSAKVIYSEAGH